MKRWRVWLGLLAAALVLWPPFVADRGAQAQAAGEVLLGRWVQSAITDFAGGSFDGVVVAPGEEEALRLLEGRNYGVYTSVQQELPFPCQAAGLLYRARNPAGTHISFELRARGEDLVWTPWMALPAGPWADPEGRVAGESLLVFPEESDQLQYRAVFWGGPTSPMLQEVMVVYLAAGADPGVAATPPWQEDDDRPRPLSPEEWGGEPAPAEEGGPPAALMQVEIRPAALALAEEIEAAPLLRMMQRYHRDVLGFSDVAYTYLIDPQGGVYQGREGPAGNVLFIGVLGAHPHETVSPTVEDALVALLDWWGASLTDEETGISFSTPSEPLLAERILARWQVGNYRGDEWFLVRGNTAPEVHEWILLSNPDPERVRVTAELYQEDGRMLRRTIYLPGGARGSLFANQLVDEGVFWARVRAAGNVLVERALYFGHDADDSVGIEHLSRAWYLPGGTQEPGFTTTLSLLNPWEETVTATVSIFAPSGPAGDRTVLLAPQSRLDLSVGEVYTGSQPIGSRVLANAPIAVEQEVRFSNSTGGYGLPGTALLSPQWTLAGVNTESPCITLLALLNPTDQAVPITLTLMSEDGTTLRREYVLPPGEQVINVNTILPGLALAAEVWAEQPIAVARITYFNGLRSAHATLGAVRLARQWYLPEGSTGEPFETFLLVANPNRMAIGLEVTFSGPQGEIERRRLHMPAHARLTVRLNDLLPDVAGLSTLVRADWPVVVERIVYLHQMQGGHSCLGVPR